MAFTKITSTNIAANTVAGYAEFANIANSLAPKITSIAITSNTYSVLDDTAVNVGGGYIVVTGSNFQSGASILIDTTSATSVTYVDSTTLRAQVPAKSAASYNLYVVNPDGGTGLKIAGITYSGSPTWVTASPLANVLSNTVFSGTFNATGATSYANTTILPTGFNLLANGYYYGNISVGAATTYSFDIKAADDENQDSIKTFGLTTLNVPPTYTVEYLIIAGGGAGGTVGGGGAGGYISNNALLTTQTVYTITIGAGGSGISGFNGRSGNNTTMSGTGLTTITAFGGGGGSAGGPNGLEGGSGGGGGGFSPNSSVNGALAIGSPAQGVAGTQGYPGGSGAFSPSVGGGGGGA